MWRDESSEIDIEIEMDDETDEASGQISNDETLSPESNVIYFYDDEDDDDLNLDQEIFRENLNERHGEEMEMNYEAEPINVFENNQISSNLVSSIPEAEIFSELRQIDQQNSQSHSQSRNVPTIPEINLNRSQQSNVIAQLDSVSTEDVNQNSNNQALNNEKNEEETKPNPLNESSEIVDSCLICCEPFTSTSDHRVVSLKCGHIFGKHCIERWLKTKESKRRCPKCNQISNKNDIRIIYAKSIISIDTTELDQAKKDLDEERRMRMLFEQQVEELKFDLGLKESENIHLKREITIKEELIKRFKSSNSNQVESNLNQIKMKSLDKPPFSLIRAIDLKVDGCRMIVVSEVLGYILISQPTSPNSLVKGFGIRRVPLNNFNSSDFIFLHQNQIKDMCLHPIDALLLTASFDKQVKICSLVSKEVIDTFNLESKPWCATWNKSNTSLFYVGLNNGYLLECSIVTRSVLKKINTCLGVPIKLIRYLNHNQNTNRVNLLITSIKTSFFCEIKSKDQSSTLNSNEEDSVVSMKPLPISGPIISTNIVDIGNNSGNILLTVRPSNKYQNNIQHYVLDFTITGNNEIQYNLLNTYLGGFQSKHLITSKLFVHPDKLDSFLVCSGDEDTQGALVWEKDNEKPIQKFFFKNVVFDIELYKPHHSSEPILALLTERHLNLYKWTN